MADEDAAKAPECKGKCDHVKRTVKIEAALISAPADPDKADAAKEALSNEVRSKYEYEWTPDELCGAGCVCRFIDEGEEVFSEERIETYSDVPVFEKKL